MFDFETASSSDYDFDLCSSKYSRARSCCRLGEAKIFRGFDCDAAWLCSQRRKPPIYWFNAVKRCCAVS